jgi:hypothetical protein
MSSYTLPSIISFIHTGMYENKEDEDIIPHISMLNISNYDTYDMVCEKLSRSLSTLSAKRSIMRSILDKWIKDAAKECLEFIEYFHAMSDYDNYMLDTEHILSTAIDAREHHIYM